MISKQKKKDPEMMLITNYAIETQVFVCHVQRYNLLQFLLLQRKRDN